MGDVSGEENVYGKLGNAYHGLGDFKKAIHYHERCLEVAKKVGNVSKEGRAYGNIGCDYQGLGDFQKAVHYRDLCLEIARIVGDVSSEGRAYNNLGNDYHGLGDFKKAIHCHELCLEIARKVGDDSTEGAAYGNLGNAFQGLGDFKKAIHYHDLYLEIARKVGDVSSEGATYGNLGNDYQGLRDFKKAVHYHDLCLEIARKVGNDSTEGAAYGNLGNDYHGLGDFKKAIHYHELCLEIARKVGNDSTEGAAYGNLGNDYHKLGDFKKAIHYHDLSLEIARKVGDVSTEGAAYGNLGNDYHKLGDFKKAVHYHDLSLEIARKVGDVSSVRKTYGNIGNDYRGLGDFQKAIHYHDLHLEIARKVGDVSSEGTTYGNLGSDYHRVGDFQKAIHYHERCLEIARKVGDVSSEGTAYSNLGNDYLYVGDFQKAIHYHERCLEIARKVGDVSSEGTAYGNLGNDYHELGDFQKALYCHERCLEIARKVGDVSNKGTAYCNLGSCYSKLGDFQKAIHYHERCLEIARKMGDRDFIGYAFNNLGAAFQSIGSLCQAEECYINSIKTLNDVRRNLAFNDDLKVSLRHLYQKVYANLRRLFLVQGKVVEALLCAEHGRAQALNDLMEFKYASKITRAESFTETKTITDIYSYLPSNTVFIALVDQGVIFWVLQKEKDVKIRGKRTPDGQVDAEDFLDTTLKKIRGRTFVKCEDRSLDIAKDDNLTDARSSPGKKQNQSSSPRNSALSLLYETIVSPIQDLLLGNEVIFVPEGPLCLAPFAAFMDSDSKYLCESFRIRVIPSLMSLKLIADCPADYHIKTGALIVGDPWIQDVTFEGTKFPQLQFARKEAQMIGRILHTTSLIGEHATKNEVLKRLSSVSLVHIAAHGRMETGEILLAPNPSPVSRTPIEEDFLLTMKDVLNAQMRARLVVLSCCHSARGEIKAEGVVGIARAFLGAGARSVLVSLWAIDDEATMEFMRIFYQHLMKGESASEALNQAMKSMRESDEFSEVDYWAPFVLIGDDVTLELGRQE